MPEKFTAYCRIFTKIFGWGEGAAAPASYAYELKSWHVHSLYQGRLHSHRRSPFSTRKWPRITITTTQTPFMSCSHYPTYPTFIGWNWVSKYRLFIFGSRCLRRTTVSCLPPIGRIYLVPQSLPSSVFVFISCRKPGCWNKFIEI